MNEFKLCGKDNLKELRTLAGINELVITTFQFQNSEDKQKILQVFRKDIKISEHGLDTMVQGSECQKTLVSNSEK